MNEESSLKNIYSTPISCKSIGKKDIKPDKVIDGGFDERKNSILRKITFFCNQNKFIHFAAEYRSLDGNDRITNSDALITEGFEKFKKYEFILEVGEYINYVEFNMAGEELDGLLLGTNLGRLIVMGGRQPPLTRLTLPRSDIFVAGFKAHMSAGLITSIQLLVYATDNLLYFFPSKKQEIPITHQTTYIYRNETSSKVLKKFCAKSNEIDFSFDHIFKLGLYDYKFRIVYIKIWEQEGYISAILCRYKYLMGNGDYDCCESLDYDHETDDFEGNNSSELHIEDNDFIDTVAFKIEFGTQFINFFKIKTHNHSTLEIGKSNGDVINKHLGYNDFYGFIGKFKNKYLVNVGYYYPGIL